MSDQTPEHRTGISPRSGDTHVIGADGVAVNTDQAARDAAAAEEAKAAKKAPRPAPPADEHNPAAA